MELPPIVVMGVSGSGKSTVAEAMAERLGGEYLDADDYHPQSNIDKMSHGIPLTDEDRQPWLTRVGGVMRAHAAGGKPVIMACSALRRTYRQRILAEVPGAFFLMLTASREELDRRIEARQGHFMPASLLLSQFAALEPLEANEHGATVSVVGPPHVVLARAIAAVQQAGPDIPLD